MQNAIKRGRPKKEKNYNSPFAARLRDLIGEKTQNEIAEELNITRQSIGQWINGNTTPDIATLCKLADYFDVSADYLLCRTDIKSPNTDLQAVCNYTGLSEEALGKLQLFGEQKTEIDVFEEAFRFFGEDISVGNKYANLTSSIVSSDEYDLFLYRFFEFILKHHAFVTLIKMHSNIKSALSDETINDFIKTELLVAIDRHLTYDSRFSDLDFNEYIHADLDYSNFPGNFISIFEELSEKLVDRCDVLEYRLDKSFQTLKNEILQQYTAPQNVDMLANRIISEIRDEFENYTDSFQVTYSGDTRELFEEMQKDYSKDLELLKKHLLGDSALQKEGAADGKHNPQEE